jgi:hypothetical protein
VPIGKLGLVGVWSYLEAELSVETSVLYPMKISSKQRPINDIHERQAEEASKKAFKLSMLASRAGHAYGMTEPVDVNQIRFLRERERQCFKNACYWDGIRVGLRYLSEGIDPCTFIPNGSIDDDSELAWTQSGFIDGYNIRDYRYRIGAPLIEGHENYDLTSVVLNDPNFLDHNLIFANL